jgi:extradiol dioxygenase family protein
VTLVVDDAAAWYAELTNRDVQVLSELEYRPEIGIRCFFLQDPGGYTLEVQQFLHASSLAIFESA